MDSRHTVNPASMVTNAELASAAAWAKTSFGGADCSALPFSFTYGGKHSSTFLAGWDFQRSTDAVDSYRTRTSITLADPDTKLVVEFEAIEYSDFPTVEWILHFRNAGTADTPIISDICALDITFNCVENEEFVLHHQTGTPYTPGDYEPFTTVLAPNATRELSTNGGRPSNEVLPYFNLDWGGTGAIVVVSWQGQWSADFIRDAGNGLRVSAGQEQTNFLLHPDERVRAPMGVVQFWDGDTVRAQNIWRRWMLAHNIPCPDGKRPGPYLSPCSSHQYAEMINADESSQRMFIDRYMEEGLAPDFWWMDAGWYPNEHGWPQTGTWEVDKKRFPDGLRAVSDHAHAKGVDIIVWFEPERVAPDTWLYDTHPEWLLTAECTDNRLLNLGNPNARRWLTDHIDTFLNDQGIDLYRQDFNIDPLPFWRENDTPDRQGITEILYVTGYLAYWDELQRSHPGMLIDSCASGGRRNDLETLRRALPFLRSDWIFEPASQQCHTYGVSRWMPYNGTGTISLDPYVVRSVFGPHIISCWDMRDESLDYDLMRKLVSQWRRVAELYFGDYYPLTSYSLANDVWMAFQFDRSDLGRGVVQVFRRAGSPYESARFHLRGLISDSTYSITNLDTEEDISVSGSELMENGLLVSLCSKPKDAIFEYKYLG